MEVSPKPTKISFLHWFWANFFQPLADGSFLMKITHIPSAPMKPSQLSSACAGRRKVSIPEKNDRPAYPSLDLCHWVGREEGHRQHRYAVEAPPPTHTLDPAEAIAQG
jgi:hypothetical protein